MTFQRVKSRKIYEEIADQIEQMIIKQELKTGQKLASVEALAKQFAVGRSAVREALSALRAKGLLEMRQGEGTFIRAYDRAVLSHAISSAVLMNAQEIRELLEVRKFLEVGCAGAAAERRRESDLQVMQSILEKMENNLHDEVVGEEADVRFHLAIAAASGNRMLTQLMDTVAGTMGARMRDSRRLWLYSDESTVRKLLDEHRAIFVAISTGNRLEAEQLMFRHLNKVEQTISRFLDKSE